MTTTFPHSTILIAILSSASTYWQTTSVETWPLRSRLQPFVNYVAPAASQKLSAATAMDNVLTPYGAYQATQSQTEKLTAAKEAQTTKQAQFETLTPYGALQATTHGNLLLISSPYYAAYSLPVAYVAPSVDTSTAPPSTTTTSTAKPATVDDIEVAKEEEEEEDDTIETLQKLRANTQTDGDLKSDARLRAAVSRINSDYVIEEIVSVPGKHVLSSSSQITAGARSSKQQLKKATAVKLRKGSAKLRSPPVKVEATGRTSSSSSNFPQIPFGSYFLPYSPIRAQAIQGRKQAALILEPHSKAVVGNGGTAISTPISKALLKKGVPTNVYFNPESVAIAGVGGKAHAAADLELDLFN